MTEKTLDTAIIGAGPAGLCAAVYASRAGLEYRIFEKAPVSGGQIINTGEVENYPGFVSIDGFELSQRLYGHALKAGAKIEYGEISKISKADGIFNLEIGGEKILSKTVIAATGAVSKRLGVKGEAGLIGKGVSYCAHCDGAFYKGKTAAVIGGGDTAIGDGLYLANICKKVYVVHRRGEFRAAGSLLNRLKKCENVEIITRSVVREIRGEEKVTSVLLENTLDKGQRELALDGVFIAVGAEPQGGLFKDLAETEGAGFIIAGEDCKTSMPGLFAAGDLRTKPLRQIVTAVADGANAVHSAEIYLRELGGKV